jgi:outer membrane lipoprotein SlyB
MKQLSSILIAAVLISGCAGAPNSANVYSGVQTQNEQTVRMGTVEAVREITINKGETGVGGMAGASLGAIAAGSNIGEGRGALAAGIAGAVVGGILGQKVEQHQAMKKGLEITVKLDGGDVRAITQDADEVFRVGDRVRLLKAGMTTRVTH